MFDKIKENLGYEISKIRDYISDCFKKQKILEANTNDSKFIKTGFISCFIEIPIAFINLINAVLTMPSTLGILSCMGIGFVSSIAIGYSVQAIITYGSNKKMKKFTDVKKNADILEEMIYYEMEKYKSINKIGVLEKIYNHIDEKRQILEEHFNDFSLIDKYDKLTIEELEKRQEMLARGYCEGMEQLDVLTSQEYLKNKFVFYRKDRNKKINIMLRAFSTGMVIFLMFSPFSSVLLKNLTEDYVKFCTLLFSPMLVVTPLSIPYFIKRDKDFRNVFHNLNQSLGENALSDEPNVLYENELKNMISRKKCEMVELGIKLKEIGYTIEKRSSENPTENKEREKGKSRDDLIPNKMEIMSSFATSTDELDVDYGNQIGNLQQGQRGSRLVKKRIPPQ